MSELGDALRELEAAADRVRQAAGHTFSDVAAKVNEVADEFDGDDNMAGDVTNPDGSVTHVDGSRTMPDGTRMNPDGTVVAQ